MTNMLRMSEEQLDAIIARNKPRVVNVLPPITPPLPDAPKPKAVRKHKFNAKRTVVDNIEFASKKEAARYSELLLLAKAGIISDLKLQSKIVLSAGGVHICDYVADFFYIRHGFPDGSHPVHEDTKGFKTPVYRLKKKLVLALTGIEIKET